MGRSAKSALMKSSIKRGLIVKQPCIDLILSGEKAWEMRSSSTKIHGKIGLIEQGTGLIVGEAELVDTYGRLTDMAIQENLFYVLHRIEDKKLLEKWPYVWVLKNVKRYDTPIPYNHPQGAVIWVKL